MIHFLYLFIFLAKESYTNKIQVKEKEKWMALEMESIVWKVTFLCFLNWMVVIKKKLCGWNESESEKTIRCIYKIEQWEFWWIDKWMSVYENNVVCLTRDSSKWFLVSILTWNWQHCSNQDSNEGRYDTTKIFQSLCFY